jgi:hypothetical protein
MELSCSIWLMDRKLSLSVSEVKMESFTPMARAFMVNGSFWQGLLGAWPKNCLKVTGLLSQETFTQSLDRRRRVLSTLLPTGVVLWLMSHAFSNRIVLGWCNAIKEEDSSVSVGIDLWRGSTGK